MPASSEPAVPTPGLLHACGRPIEFKNSVARAMDSAGTLPVCSLAAAARVQFSLDKARSLCNAIAFSLDCNTFTVLLDSMSRSKDARYSDSGAGGVFDSDVCSSADAERTPFVERAVFGGGVGAADGGTVEPHPSAVSDIPARVGHGGPVRAPAWLLRAVLVWLLGGVANEPRWW